MTELGHYYIHHNGGAVMVKEAAFFEDAGGLDQEWGERWVKVQAESIEHARSKWYGMGDQMLTVGQWKLIKRTRDALRTEVRFRVHEDGCENDPGHWKCLLHKQLTQLLEAHHQDPPEVTEISTAQFREALDAVEKATGKRPNAISFGVGVRVVD